MQQLPHRRRFAKMRIRALTTVRDGAGIRSRAASSGRCEMDPSESCRLRARRCLLVGSDRRTGNPPIGASRA